MKILFVINNMKIGGTRRSLINFLKYLENYNVNVDLLLFSPYGEYMDEIPWYATVLSGNRKLQSSFSEVFDLKHDHKYFQLFLRGVLSIEKKVFGEQRVLTRIFKQYISSNIEENQYDAIVGFQEGLCNDFVALTGVKSKIAWIHNNYENLDRMSRGFLNSYEHLNHIVFVAEASMNSFARVYPQFQNKLLLIKNILPQEDICIKALQPIEDKKIFVNGKINLISVGRVVPQKAFDRVVEVGEYLKSKDIDFNWIILGEGPNRGNLQQQAIELGLGKQIHFVGSRTNPYPYIKAADLFVLTSHYESQPMALMEALTLGTPVISTRFESVGELLENKKFGIIVDNNVEALSSCIKQLISKPELIEGMKKATSFFVYDNDISVRQFFDIIK